jgi:hypothetical protein
MYSRVTQLEIDALRISVDDAVALFGDSVLPELREQAGYEGVIVLTTPEGKALLISFWATPEAAEADSPDGFYAEQLAQHVTLFKSPPGRERYRMAFADMPTVTEDAM